MLLKMNIKWIVLGLAILVVPSAEVVAQENASSKPQIIINLAQDDHQSGKIEIYQPVQIENLLNLQIANNRLQEGIPGHRIQIFSDSKQTAGQKSIEVRMNFMRSFPDIEADRKYDPPNFKIFVGNFRTKSEALRELQKIKKIFPRAFIVNEIIQIEK